MVIHDVMREDIWKDVRKLWAPLNRARKKSVRTLFTSGICPVSARQPASCLSDNLKTLEALIITPRPKSQIWNKANFSTNLKICVRRTALVRASTFQKRLFWADWWPGYDLPLHKVSRQAASQKNRCTNEKASARGGVFLQSPWHLQDRSPLVARGFTGCWCCQSSVTFLVTEWQLESGQDERRESECAIDRQPT